MKVRFSISPLTGTAESVRSAWDESKGQYITFPTLSNDESVRKVQHQHISVLKGERSISESNNKCTASLALSKPESVKQAYKSM